MRKTRLCEMLGIDVPIVGAPFGPWDGVQLAAAISEAGGLGSLGTAVRPLPELEAQWARLRDLTARPFAINHTARPFDEATFAATLAVRPAAISFHIGPGAELIGRAHDAGILWMQTVMDVDQAEESLAAGADILIAQGGEGGGHAGFLSTMVLVPQVVDLAGDVPVVAAGGIADGRGLAAALALGAQGVCMGTRFIATREMGMSDGYKSLVVGASSRDTVRADFAERVLPPYNRPHYPSTPRVIRTPFVEHWNAQLDEAAAAAPQLGPQIVDAVLRGGGEEYIPFAGQSVGLVHEVGDAGEIVRRTVAEAEAILGRLAS